MKTANEKLTRAAACVLAASFGFASLASAQTVIFSDGFGDGDRDNDGLLDGPNAVVEDPGDTGIEWYSIGGFTGGGTGDPKPLLTVEPDPAGLGSGNALGYEGKGGGSAMMGVLPGALDNGPVTGLGANVGDKIRLEFDMRLWTQSANPTPVPASGILRFGFYRDADEELGDVNSTAGVNGTPAVWGGDDGAFEGGSPGAQFDVGWFAGLPVGTNGNLNNDLRIRGEANADNNILSGSDQWTIVAPDDTSGLSPIADEMLHHVQFDLERIDDGSGGTNILAKLVVDDITYLEGELDTENDFIGVPANLYENFDYVAFKNQSTDFDMLIDNVQLVLNPLDMMFNPADFNEDGVVDVTDLGILASNWQMNGDKSMGDADGSGFVDVSDLGVLASNWQDGVPMLQALADSQVPEPASISLLGIAGLTLMRRRRH